MSTQPILLSDLARELGMHKSHARKYAIKQGVSFLQVRTIASRGQYTLALSEQDAAKVRQSRLADFGPVDASETDKGWLYVMQVIPDLDPLRVKLGFAVDVPRRLDQHRTILPGVQLVTTWPCRAWWERTAIDSITRVECTLLGQEVFACVSLEGLIERGGRFFEMMPV